MNAPGLAIWKWKRGAAARREMDEVATEEPLEIQVETRAISVTMRTPGHDEELAIGFLLTEGILSSSAQVERIQPHPRNAHGNAINVFLKAGVSVDFTKLTRHFFASSSCGVCGKASIDQIHRQFKALRSSARVSAETLLSLPPQMRTAQASFDRTGGIHAAALYSLEGRLLVLREDVGRHNAVDKVVGHAALQGWLPLNRSILLVSGRTSFEIVQKALAARIPVIAAVSAPSSLAVDFARRNRQTLVGFLRDDRMNLYCGKNRVKF